MPISGELIGSLITVFWVWMLIDCLFNKALDNKLGWALFIIFTQIVGAVFYFFIKCTNRNPVEAVSSYYQTVVQWTQATNPPPSSAPYYTPPTPTQAQPVQHEYQEGYSAYQYQPPAQQTVVPVNAVPNAQPAPAQSSDEQYEQPIITYPEM